MPVKNPETYEQLRPLLRQAAERLPRQVRFRALNALEGCDKALALLEIDREIASFRAITAEEEAAVALFASLQLRGYPGAERLVLRDHRHKAALWPFLSLVSRALSKTVFADLKIILDQSVPRIDVHFPLANFGIEAPPDLHLMPVEPLGVIQQKDGRPYLFEAEKEELARSLAGNDINRYISQLANSRNRLLYASEQGMPASEVTAEDLAVRRSNVETAVFLSIAICQTTDRQLFAMQCLQAFLAVVRKAEGLEIPYPPLPEPEVIISAARPEGENS